ncbi:uncharacterized protein LOC6533998 [Drosophila yakuba]|uniref:Uncharacterized protein n=1 Tax=Drosophila yakuba TaxID=7245 RepID=B4PHD8_DROYA|nr:uncharacterized protein LOC6533998 [Drosophila yakuba]EDW94399.2 uncharacterized protein Dyak_GE21965 [Drosophila yakuba]
MKTTWSFCCGVLLLCAIVCSGQNVTKSNDSQEIIRVKILPQSTSSDPSTGSSSSSTATPTTTTPKPKGNPTAKSAIKAQEIEEEDDNFHNDRLPALSEDEYNNLSEDANPLHFLKQRPLDLENEEVLPNPEKTELTQKKPESQTESKPDSQVVASQSAGSPIYITIPIYISTGGKLPITLTVGDQELSLKKTSGSGSSRRNPSTKSPNSFFNRLLQQIEPPKRRTTNRHRSQLRNHVYAMKDNKGKEGRILKDFLFNPMQ